MEMFHNIPSVIQGHYKKKQLNWPMIIYISLVHALGTAGLFKISQCSAETLIWAFILWPIR
jgi:hypothetical protein